MRIHISLLAAAAISTAAAAQTAPTAHAVLAKMRATYDGKWYKTLTFTQTTIITRASGATDTSTWYESMSGVRLRIDRGDLSAATGSIQTADSTFSVRNGVPTRPSANGNVFIPLIQGVYVQPVDVTEKQLRGFKFNLDSTYVTTWNGHRVVVVGASNATDSTSPQFVIDTERNVLLRVRGNLFGPQPADITLDGYVKAGGGWLATRVVILNGPTRQVEEYHDWKVDVPLSEALYDPAQWKTAPHWARKGQ